MNYEKTPVCEWPDCGRPPSRHARFGLHVLSIKDQKLPEAPYLYYHSCLCEEHIAETQSKYVDVTTYDLGQCPECKNA